MNLHTDETGVVALPYSNSWAAVRSVALVPLVSIIAARLGAGTRRLTQRLLPAEL